MTHEKDEETPMTALIRQTSALESASPPARDPRIAEARVTMRDELAANLQLLDVAARELEVAEQRVKAAMAELAAAVDARNDTAGAYNAGVRNFGRMLGSVAQVRRHLGDDDAEVLAVLEHALPEPDQWPVVEWPEDQWPASDLVNPDGFDVDRMAGNRFIATCVSCDEEIVWWDPADAPLTLAKDLVMCGDCMAEESE